MNAPLTDRDYAQIREAVMREVRRPQPAVRRPVFAFAFAVLVIAFVSFVVARQPLTRPSDTLSPHREESVNVAPVAAIAPRPAEPGEGGRRPGEGPHPKRKHHPIQLATVRMDIQTADPDVRIIWFAR
jgi:hypothetical protein